MIEGFAKALHRNIRHADRFCCEVHQLQTGVECGLNVVPKVYHWVELENTSAINRVEIVVIQEVENDVLAQTRTNQPGEANDQMVAKMAFDKLFQ